MVAVVNKYSCRMVKDSVQKVPLERVKVSLRFSFPQAI